MEGRQQGQLERRDHLALAALGIAGFLAAILTTSWYGMSWDEGYYYPCYEDAWAWLVLLFSRPGEAFSIEGIAAGWQRIDELPPVTRWIGALFVGMTPPGWELETVRLFPALLFGGTLSLIYAAARHSVSFGWALAGALFYATHPRLFGHAHFAATETVFCFLVALVVWLGSRDVSRCNDRIWLAVLMGVALATKVNGVILMIAVILWLAGRNLLTTRTPRWAPDLRAIGLLLVVSPVVAFLLWPLMWTDPLARIGNYIAFVRDHQLTPTWYLGTRWAAEGAPNTPWHYPLVMTMAASPLLFLTAVLLGVFSIVARVASNRGRLESFDLLLLLMVLGPFSASSLPGAPKYDGLRLFVPMFVPLALLIARIGAVPKVEAGASLSSFASWISRTRGVLGRPPVLVALILVHAGLVIPAAGSGLRYYNEATRFATSGSEVFPLERMYWMEGLTQMVLAEMEEVLPEGEVRIRTLAMHGATLEVQQRWGRIPSRYRINPDPPYDVHLMQNRKGFWSRTERGFFRYRVPLRTWPEGSANPYLLLYDGALPDFPAVVPFTGPEFGPELNSPTPIP